MNRQDTYTTTGAQKQAGESTEKEAWNKAAPFPIAENIQKLKVAVTAACQCKTQLEAALVYAKFGIPVFPCNWKLDNESKYPMLGKGGLYLATTDLKRVREWWTEWPEALIAVPMGRRTGVWALDVDAKGETDGREIWWNLQVEHDITDTRTHKTGTDGFHLLFQWDDDQPVGNSLGNLPKGMGEVKGEGGYIIFPPSPYVLNGKTLNYGVSQDIEPEPASDWLYDLIIGSRFKSNGADTEEYAWSEGHGQKWLDKVCEQVRTATKGHWDEARRKVFWIGRLVGGGALDEDAAWEALEKAARQCHAPDDYVGEVKRSFKRGTVDPAKPPKSARVRKIPESQWLGERLIAAPPALIKGVFPQTGVAIIGGQSGTGKTFHAIYLATCLVPECNQHTYIDQYPIKRKGGVLYIVLEGKSAFPMRVMAAFEAMLGKKMVMDGRVRFPFAWNTFEPNIYNDKDSADHLIRLAEREAAKMRQDFGVDLVTLMIDTMGLAACYENEDKAAQVQRVVSRLSRVSDATGALVIGVDHYGKDQEAGLRGSSAKRGHVETVLSCLKDKENGDDDKPKNLRMKFEKIRDGEEGRVIPYRLKVIDWGVDEDKRPVDTCVIQWETQRPLPKKKGRGRPNKGNPTLQMAIDEIKLPAEPEALRQAFYRHYGANDKAANTAWHRALEKVGLDLFHGKLDYLP
jgi:KaiC/GvpD/RAD55 family RecA-like ATPase